MFSPSQASREGLSRFQEDLLWQIFHTEDHIVGGSLTAITPDDNADIKACFVYVGVGGDLNVVAAGDTAAVVLKNVPTGSLLPIKTIRIKSTNTTATNLVAVR